MEKSVEVLFTQAILNRFLTTFQLEENVKKLGDFENYVFEVYRNGEPFILRITHSTHRKAADIEAELDWISFLHQYRVKCPEVYLSPNGNWIEPAMAADGSRFFACLFSKAHGEPVKVNSEEFDEHLFYAWGKAIGQMHSATKHYQPREGLKLRPIWNEYELIEIEKFLPKEKEITISTQELMEELFKIPQTLDNFGLLHTDIHSGNFFYDGELIHVFDFDDCSYHWFASDIAIPLYYSLLYRYTSNSEAERKAFANHFLQHFLRGYQEENKIPENLYFHLPLFLRLRDITLYAVFHKKIAPQDRNERINHLLIEIKERIIHKVPIVQIH